MPVCRLVYAPNNNRIPTYYTITGGTTNDPNIGGTHKKLADYVTLRDFSDSFEGSFHGQVHCNIGAHAGTLFRNGRRSRLRQHVQCQFAEGPDVLALARLHRRDVPQFLRAASGRVPDAVARRPSAKPWMADNATDIANNGTMPSPGTHWISPDVWNRRTLVATDACLAPVDSYGDHDSSGGVVRNCGSDADHENPVAGVTNYLYGTLRNTRPGSPRVVYAEVGVYYALASSGLTYPADFTFIPESRQFIALHLEPGTTTSIGPIPWTPPPVPPANDHYCLYLRVLSVQTAPPTEGMGIDADVANNNTLAWRNIKVVPPGDVSPPSFFIVRNIGEGPDRLALRFEMTPQLKAAGASIRVTLDEALRRALTEGKGKAEGFRAEANGGFVMTGEKAEIVGILMKPRQTGQVKVELGRTKPNVRGADLTVTQVSAKGVDGGVTMRLSTK